MASKSDLVHNISKQLPDIPERDIAESIDLVFDYLGSELKKQNRIEIRGFGSFSTRERKFAGRADTYKTVYFRSSTHLSSLAAAGIQKYKR